MTEKKVSDGEEAAAREADKRSEGQTFENCVWSTPTSAPRYCGKREPGRIRQRCVLEWGILCPDWRPKFLRKEGGSDDV